MKCNKCKRILVLHAFSQGKCKICGCNITTPHIPSYEVCEKCSKEKNLCEQCGEEIDHK